jgi:Glycosyl hydrolase catalytic core
VFRGLLVICAATCAAAVIAAPPASAQPRMMIGFLDQASTFYDAEATFPTVQKLHAQIVRADLYWSGGGAVSVTKHRPTNAKNPDDPAYNWAPYDHLVQVAARHKVKILFTIWGTPGWANGGHTARYAPTKGSDLQAFAYAAAKHFSGTEVDDNGVTIPAVRLWTAWNEPNQLFQLYPQYKRIQGKYVMVSAINYAKICTAVYTGVHATLLKGEKVACGVTAPRGNNNARGKRGTPSPQAFMIAIRKAGMKKFDAYAHNPYNGPHETPTTKPHTKGAYTLGNLGDMINQVTKLWGRKRIWLTEYAYQTNPPDRVFGVSYAKQALYLKQAFAIARKNPRVDMMLWFQVKDEPGIGGWQSGLITSRGKKKPAYATYSRMPH